MRTIVNILFSLSLGKVYEIDALRCAEISGRIGAGRSKSCDPINYAVGLELCVHIGSKVEKGW
jgi:thymidine phosphorylase